MEHIFHIFALCLSISQWPHFTQLILLTIYCNYHIYYLFVTRWWYFSKLRTIFWSLYLSFCLNDLNDTLHGKWNICVQQRNQKTSQILFVFHTQNFGKTEWCTGKIETHYIHRDLFSTYISFLYSFIFSSSPYCYKDCFLALAKIHLNHTGGGGGGQYDLTKKRNSSKMHSCTAAAQGHSFGLFCFSS